MHHRGIVLAVHFHSQFGKNPIDEAKVVREASSRRGLARWL